MTFYIKYKDPHFILTRYLYLDRLKLHFLHRLILPDSASYITAMHLSSTSILCALAAFVAPVIAEIAASTGDFAVTLNEKLYNPESGKSAKWEKKTDSTCRGYINVRGKHVGYDIDCRTLGVYNYTLTGFNDTQRKYIISRWTPEKL